MRPRDRADAIATRVGAATMACGSIAMLADVRAVPHLLWPVPLTVAAALVGRFVVDPVRRAHIITALFGMATMFLLDVAAASENSTPVRAAEQHHMLSMDPGSSFAITLAAISWVLVATSAALAARMLISRLGGAMGRGRILVTIASCAMVTSMVVMAWRMSSH